MKNRKLTASAGLVAAVAVAATALIATGISSAAPKAGFKMAIVTDIGSLQDRSFNQLANQGRIAVGKDLGIPTRVYETKAENQRVPNMLAASRAGYNLIFAVGFLNYNAVSTVAPRFPKLQYVGIDEPYVLYKSKPKNAAGQQSAEQEAGYLVGYLAALELKREGGKQIMSAVGANPVPAIQRYISGYIQGAKKGNPSVKVFANYANDLTFNDQAKCAATADQQLTKGTRVIFQVAGGCGLGALNEAKKAGIWGIGVDADQRYLGSFMMTSALKTVDRAVVDLTRLAYAGNLATQRDYNYNLRNGGVGLGSVSPRVPKALVSKTKAIGRKIASGQIKVKPIIKF